MSEHRRFINLLSDPDVVDEASDVFRTRVDELKAHHLHEDAVALTRSEVVSRQRRAALATLRNEAIISPMHGLSTVVADLIRMMDGMV